MRSDPPPTPDKSSLSTAPVVFADTAACEPSTGRLMLDDEALAAGRGAVAVAVKAGELVLVGAAGKSISISSSLVVIVLLVVIVVIVFFMGLTRRPELRV